MQNRAPRNVLIFPATTEIGLEIFNSLRCCKEVNIFGAGDDSSRHGRMIYSEYSLLPNINEEGWFEELVHLCERLEIDYIFPAYDDVIVALMERQQEIPAAVMTSSSKTCRITRSKSETYRLLHETIRVPRIYEDAENISDFPLLVKPDKGQGSFGITKVGNREELMAAIRSIPEPLICEYLPGEEYTVDCFSDREHGVLFAKARMRCKTRNGISVNTVTVNLEKIQEMAEKISARLELRGAWFFQLKRDQKERLTLLEVAPRIAGSMAANRVMGINFPLLTIFEHERLPLKVLLNRGEIELDRSLCNRYRHEIEFDTMYVDLDDTLIFNEEVNADLIKLIFQCFNRGKKVKLITRHKHDVGCTLARFKLTGLFDQVIHMLPGMAKSAYIHEPGAILVDDSFSERLEVAAARKIPTFDCSMIEMLIQEDRSMQSGDEAIRHESSKTMPLLV